MSAKMESPISVITCVISANVNINDSWEVQEEMTGKDASWILTTSVIIFTMQTGFGLLESGSTSQKSEVNIMIKNLLDVVFGGITYWAFGFGLSFGDGWGSNPFVGIGCFFVDAGRDNMGYVFSVFLFQLSFATTATTIVSGSMTERCRLSAYIIFSLLNTLIYSIPAHWLWSHVGFLFKLGAVDVAGCGPVHLIGGVTGLVASLMLKPRISAFQTKHKPPLPSPLKSILGMFMLWWGWLRFSSGSVFIMSVDHKWKVAVRAGVTTITASMAGGMTGVLLSFLIFRFQKSDIRYDISIIINSVLASLVSITGICTLCRPWEALIIGAIGAILACAVDFLLYKIQVDDPVGVVSVHGVCGIWGLLAVGLFMHPEDSHLPGQGGLFKTGQFYLLAVQALTCGLIIIWTILTSFVILKIIDLTIGLRLSLQEEQLGVDNVEHGIILPNAAMDSKRLETLNRLLEIVENMFPESKDDEAHQILLKKVMVKTLRME